MNALLQSINKELFRHDSLEQSNVEELKQFVVNYPFAAVGHLLLASKMGSGNEEVSTASLYLHDPLVLNLLLRVQENPGISTKGTVTDSPLTEVQEISSIETTEVDSADANEFVPEPGEEGSSIPETDEGKMEENELAFKLPSLKITENPVTAGQELSFEPYHTVDYFASQGIRLRREDLEKDQFGRQLRSFTDWLRSMKRIEPIAAENQAPSASEDSIKQHAAESIEERDVETEAMAEVWIKQGKTARAMAIYKKLSLLNPSKSHYFAAKIEQLKDL